MSLLKKIKFKDKSGFTIIELMVATSIFVVIMLAGMGSLIITSNSAKKAQTLNFTMDNLNFAMESMSRSLRMGTNYYCSSNFTLSKSLPTLNCSNGASGIAFIPSEKSSSYRMAYRRKLRNNGTGTYTIERCDTDTWNCIDMISGNINVENLTFFVRGSSKSDNLQPSTYMIVRGTLDIKGEEVAFAIQTMVSQRTLD